VAPLYLDQFIQPALVPRLTRESGRQKPRHDFTSQFDANHSLAETEHVHVVVLDALVG
jgi:hypothetical protein